MSKLNLLLSISLLVLMTGTDLFGQVRIKLNSFGSGFIRPVDISHAGDGRLFITEQRGRIHILRPDGSVDPVPFLNIESQVRSSGNEQGLLGLAFHPDYKNNGYFYVNYIGLDRNTRVSRFQVDSLNPNLADPTSEQVLFSITQPYSNHNGGDLNFGPDGYLYIALGDGGSAGDPQDNGQKGLSLLGKILRIDVNQGNPYAVPADNPFVNNPNVRSEIWSMGWRNPWRFSFDRQTGDMWIADVGQNAFEEVSFEPDSSSGGLNYGWRCLEGENIYNATGCGQVSDYIGPVFEYAHSYSQGSSITGGFIYRGNNYPALQGHYVFGDYNSGQFWTIFKNELSQWDTTRQGYLLTRDQCSSFGEDVNGELYVASLRDGVIYQIEETTNGIDEKLKADIRAYPNPFTDEVKLVFDNPSGERYQLRVFDTQGQLLKVVNGIQNDIYTFKREDLLPGIYLIELAGDRKYVGKILIMD